MKTIREERIAQRPKKILCSRTALIDFPEPKLNPFPETDNTKIAPESVFRPNIIPHNTVAITFKRVYGCAVYSRRFRLNIAGRKYGKHDLKEFELGRVVGENVPVSLFTRVFDENY